MISFWADHYIVETKHVFGKEWLTKWKRLESLHWKSCPINILSKSHSHNNSLIKLWWEIHLEINMYAIRITCKASPRGSVSKISLHVTWFIAFMLEIEVSSCTSIAVWWIEPTTQALNITCLASIGSIGGLKVATRAWVNTTII